MEFAIAEELGKTRGELLSLMTPDEFFGWVEFRAWKAKQVKTPPAPAPKTRRR